MYLLYIFQATIFLAIGLVNCTSVDHNIERNNSEILPIPEFLGVPCHAFGDCRGSYYKQGQNQTQHSDLESSDLFNLIMIVRYTYVHYLVLT